MKKTEWIAKVSVLSALAFVLMLFEFPLPFIAPPFYKFDFSELPVLVGTFALGPLAGVTIELIKVLLNLLTNGTITAGVGELSNFVVGVFFILPAGYIYKKNKCKKNAILGMVIGSIAMVIVGGFVNAYVLIPAYGKALGAPISTFVDMGAKIHPSINSLEKLVLLCVVPFNAIKALVVSVLAAFIYKPLSPMLKRNIIK